MNYVFIVLAIVFIIISFRNSKKIKEQNEKIVELAQRCALLEFEIENR